MKKFALILFTLLITTQAFAEDLTLWYEKPADPEKWTEALPVGNGRLGAMVFGDTSKERIQLNEESLWAGCQFDPFPDDFSLQRWPADRL